MKFSVFSSTQWPEGRIQSDVFRDELEQLSVAEEQGYDGAWMGENHFSRHGIGPSIHLAAASLAARTSRIRVGMVVTILPFMHPLRVAEEIAMLDIMSGGRIEWGAGCGYPRQELDGSGVEAEDGTRMFEEQLQVIRQAWAGEPFSHEGEFFQFPELRCLPTPVQEPRPPIFITALSSSLLEWAADNHYPVLTDPFASTERIEESRGIYSARAERAGFDISGIELPVLRQVYVGETMQKAREEAAPALLSYYRTLRKIGPPAPDDEKLVENDPFHRFFCEGGFDPDRDPERLLSFLFESCTIIGDVAYCRDKIVELRERIGLDHLLSWHGFGNLPHQAVMASQRRLIEEVDLAVS